MTKLFFISLTPPPGGEASANLPKVFYIPNLAIANFSISNLNPNMKVINLSWVNYPFGRALYNFHKNNNTILMVMVAGLRGLVLK